MMKKENENGRESFVFYRSFYKAIKGVDPAIQAEIYTALMEYALDGVEPENLSPIAHGFLILMRPQIDANTRRYNNGCQNKGSKKEKKESAPAEEQPATDEDANLATKATLANEDEPDSANAPANGEPAQPMNDDILTDEESARFQLLFPHTHRNRSFLYFIRWIKDNVPYCADASEWEHGITEDEFERLINRYKYSYDEIAKTTAEIANRTDLRHRYNNLYLTVLNWMKFTKPLS